MGHDVHFLERLDRVESGDLLALALGLYRDHELVKYVLTHVHLPDGAERVALALDDGGEGPHVVVTRGGAFVTCLGRGMSTGALPVVPRGRLDALAARVERVRDGLALAKKRGLDEARVIGRIRRGGPSIPREDFVAATAMLGDAAPVLLGVYGDAATFVEETVPLLRGDLRGLDVGRKRATERKVATEAWGMAHSAMLVAHGASRDWVTEWSKLEAHDRMSPWAFLVMQSAFPFVVRAAWVAGRLGKPMFSPYKARFFEPVNTIDMQESGWGLLCMALRHESLRSEAFKALRSPPRPPGQAPWAAQRHEFFASVAGIILEKEETLLEEARTLGRDCALLRFGELPETSPYRCRERADVPEDLVLPALFDGWFNANVGDRAADVMLLGLVAAAGARAEDFYFPAATLHAMGQPETEEMGRSLVEMRALLHGTPQPVRAGPRIGRNDPCHCGSGKKYKKCHGR
jgi:hypothetical protein